MITIMLANIINNTDDFSLSGGYTEVAVIDTTDLNTVFARAQNHDTLWQDQNGVFVKSDSKKLRSMCVGDIMKKDGVCYVITACGYEVMSMFDLYIAGL